jgi:DNA-binding transcriptional regulator PaaX
LLNVPRSRITAPFGLRPDFKPNASQLAIALATLEREKYLAILAAEYIAHARGLASSSPNLDEVLSIYQRITKWVASSILSLDHYKDRCKVKTFFVNTAEVMIHHLEHLTCMSLIEMF